MTSRPTNIIQCEHDREFTVITNKLLSDKSLALDEKGLLCWFLSLPKDWEIRPAHVCKEHNIGRDKYHRIMKALRDQGYSKMVIERAQDGTIVCIRHLVAETPKFLYEAPEYPDERVCEIEDAEMEAIATGVASLQQPGFPDRDEPYPDNPDAYKELKDSLNPDSHKRGGADFPDLRKKWPTDDVLSPLVCEKLFLGLPRKDRQQAIDAAEPYLTACRSKNRKICDLSTYLKERRFDRSDVQPSISRWEIKPGTPQARRWLESNQLTPFAAEQLRCGNPITALTEFPKSTGPPPESNLMTSEDYTDFNKKWG